MDSQLASTAAGSRDEPPRCRDIGSSAPRRCSSAGSAELPASSTPVRSRGRCWFAPSTNSEEFPRSCRCSRVLGALQVDFLGLRHEARISAAAEHFLLVKHKAHDHLPLRSDLEFALAAAICHFLRLPGRRSAAIFLACCTYEHAAQRPKPVDGAELQRRAAQEILVAASRKKKRANSRVRTPRPGPAHGGHLPLGPGRLYPSPRPGPILRLPLRAGHQKRGPARFR